jgi:cytochrome c6
MKRIFMISLVGAAVCIFVTMPFAEESSKEKSGESLFQMHCSPCHPDGGNLLNPKKTLSKKDREANNIITAADIVNKMRNPGPFPEHPQEWAGMKMFDEKTISDRDAKKIAEYVLKTFK